MSKANNSVREITNKIDAIKKISQDPTGLIDTFYENHAKNLVEDDNKKINNGISDLKSKVSKIAPPKNNIFDDIIKIANSFFTDPNIKVSTGNTSQQKLLKYTQESAITTIKQSKEIVSSEMKNLFSGSISEICSGNAVMSNKYTYEISPKEFDFLNMLKVSPDSITGKIMYENNEDIGKVKFNKELFNVFNSHDYNFNSINGENLFNITWDDGSQIYRVTLSQNLMEVRDFFDNYYESIEYPNIDYVIKTAMLLTLQGDGTEGIDFTNGLNNLERFIKKLLQFCNLLNTDTNILKHNPVDAFNEMDDDMSYYFDFNNTEGIDIDDEDARYRKVLKFKNCNVFEIPINTTHIEDFVYFNKVDTDSVIDTIKNASDDVDDEGSNTYFLSLFNSYITKMPIALLSSVLCPKILFPIVLAYKVVNNLTKSDLDNDAKILLGKMKTAIKKIMGKLFKIFLTTLWSFIKVELLKFLAKQAKKILLNKLGRYKNIVLALISLLTRLLSMDINNCMDVYKLITLTIDAALNLPIKMPIPGLLLSISDYLPGFSTDRAYMNIVEQMSNMGVETGTLYGESNDLLTIIKSNVDGLYKEIDGNSFIKVSNKEIILPFGVIPPGILTSAGKMF